MSDKEYPEKEVIIVDCDDDILESIGSELERNLLKNTPDKENPTHYVKNKDLYNAIKAYKIEFNEAVDNGLPEPRVPEYIGECFLKMATNVAKRPEYVNYPHKEEMIGDAIENCLKYVKNFDPELGSNPFAYYTTFIYRAFWRRIEQEKKQLYIQALKVRRMGNLENSFDVMDEDEADYHNTYVEYMQENGDDIITDFEAKIQAKKEKVAARKQEKTISKGLADKAKKKQKPKNKE